jgi:general stress protein 26
MKIETQSNPELAVLSGLIEDFTVAMLTNVDATGALVSHPMTPLEMDTQGAVWFFTDSRYTRAEHLKAVNLAFADAGKATFVSLAGSAELIRDPVRIERLWTAYARPWFPTGPSDPNLSLLKFTPSSAQYWDAPNSKAVRVFAMAASIAAAKPIGLGKTETVTDL